MNKDVEVRKLKGEEYDVYECWGCGKQWKSTSKKIGHKEASCKKRK